MKEKEWLGVMQKAADYDHNMTKLIEKYGEMLVNEEVFRRYRGKLREELIKFVGWTSEEDHVVDISAYVDEYLKSREK